jgi:hypothetical protein
MSRIKPDRIPDHRSEDLIQAHSALALASLKNLNERYDQLAHSHGLPKRPTTTLYQYPMQLSYAGLFFTAIGVDFDNTNYGWSGQGGGLAVGAGTAWGMAYFNYTLDQLNNWETNFEFEGHSVYVQLNLWGLKGEIVGSIFAGGLGLGTFAVGGRGQFFQYEK